jgi:hypothetical protein
MSSHSRDSLSSSYPRLYVRSLCVLIPTQVTKYQRTFNIRLTRSLGSFGPSLRESEAPRVREIRRVSELLYHIFAIIVSFVGAQYRIFKQVPSSVCGGIGIRREVEADARNKAVCVNLTKSHGCRAAMRRTLIISPLRHRRSNAPIALRRANDGTSHTQA